MIESNISCLRTEGRPIRSRDFMENVLKCTRAWVIHCTSDEGALASTLHNTAISPLLL